MKSEPLIEIVPRLVPKLTEAVVLEPQGDKKHLPLTSHARPILYALKKVKPSEKAPAPVIKAYQLVAARKKQVAIGLIGLLLVIGIGFGAISLWTTYHNRQASKTLAAAKQQVAMAQALKGQDNKKAMELIQEAAQTLETLKQKYPKLVIDPELLSTIAQQKQELFAVVAVEDPEVLFNLKLIKDSFVGAKLVVSGNTMVAIDQTAPTILLLDISNKTGAIASGGQKLPNFITAGLANDMIVALLPDGVYAVNSDTGDPKQIIKKEDLWKKVVDLATFGSNIYLLDQEAGQIWKYAGDGASYGTAKNVVNETSGLLASPQALMIDGTFWVTQQGSIVEVQDGRVVPFKVENIDTPLGQTIKLASSADSKHLYILDKQHNRVVVATFDGVYTKQYQAKSLGQVVDIGIADDESKLYLLTKDKILQIPLSI